MFHFSFLNAGNLIRGMVLFITEKQLNRGMLSKHAAGEFDPIKQHHHFCPWVNGNVAAAGCSSGGAMALCGWQLTIDALDAYHTQGHIPAATMESESAASLYKV